MSYVVMLCGLPGVGKSTIAEKISKRLGIEVLSLAETRRELGHKRYRPTENKKVFKLIYSRAEEKIEKEESFILDSNFVKGERVRAFELIERCKPNFLIVEIVCSEKISKSRMRNRPKNDGLFRDSRNPKVFDVIKPKWVDMNLTLEDFSFKYNYVVFDSEKNVIDRILVVDSFVDSVLDVL